MIRLEDVVSGLFIISFVSNMANQVIGTAFVFDRSRMGKGVYALAVLVLASFVLDFVFILSVNAKNSVIIFQILATAMCIFSIILFHAARVASRKTRFAVALSPLQPSHIVMEGPYAFVRHPFYSSYILFWASAAVFAPGAVTVSVMVLMVVTYLFIASSEEAAIQASASAENYRDYQRRVGMLFPKLSLDKQKAKPPQSS